MKAILRLAFGILALIAMLAGVAVTLPDHVNVARSVVINAPEAAIFPYLNDLHRVAAWSSYLQRDPQMRLSFSGPQAGEGAKLAWSSDQRSVGAGEAAIVKSEPPHRVDLNVDYNGLQGTSFFAVAPAGSGCKVTWGFGYDTGPSLIKRWKGLLLDRIIGTEYDHSLVQLKRLVERDVAPEDSIPGDGQAETQTVPETRITPATPVPGSGD